MWVYNNNSELYHHGILGMKWGHHGSKGSTSSGSKKRSSYSQIDRSTDKAIYGVNGQKKIEDKVKAGHSKTLARGQEFVKSQIKGWATVALFADISTGGGLHRTAAYYAKQEAVKAGNKFVSSYMAKKAAKSIVKIAQNSKFNPIDVPFTVIG